MNIERKETDVVVIGNGPSGISMSYLLSGWTPYYQPQGVPDDDLLYMRLSYLSSINNNNISLTEMNLEDLSDGLEGRTSNPVALVFDQLCHPYADLGLNLPSQLRWCRQESRALNHIVIGKESKPGGVWQNIQGDLKTLSRSSWMELPNYTLREYLKRQQQMNGDGDAYTLHERALVSQVSGYYNDYVKEMDLSNNFLNDCLVTSVQKVPLSPQLINEDTGEVEGDVTEYIWEVSVLRLNEDACNESSHMTIRAKNVVLATGTCGVSNMMAVPGEHLDFVQHGVSSVGETLSKLVKDQGYPVLVIGSGLSASDAILTARNENMNVIHVFRETPCGNPSLMLKKLPKAIYPEYVRMYELMCGDVEAEWYKSYAQYTVHSFLENNRVVLESQEGDREILEISCALVQIGSSPDLSFMPSQGTNLGLVQGMKIDPKHNPVDVSPFTNECCTEKGLYALGPLVGDNFVRFIKGGAIAIVQHIQMKQGIIKL